MNTSNSIPASVIEELISTLKGVREELCTLKSEIERIGPAQLDFVFTQQKAAASYLGVSPRTVARMIDDGRLHVVEREGAVGILQSELDARRRMKS